jgi:hypothetical protein
MPSYTDDCAFGNSNQTIVKTILDEIYGVDHVEQSRYATFDFISADGKRYVEVKSRRCAITNSPTSYMGANKVDAARAMPDKDVVFVWVYTDGIFCLDYDPILFDNFTRGSFRRSDRVGIRDFDADTVFVPSYHLRPLRTPVVDMIGSGVADPSPLVVPLQAPSVVST